MAYAVPLLPPQTVGVLLLTEKAYQQWVACIDVTDRRLRIPILSRGQARLRREKLSLPRLLALYAGICDTALLTWGDDGRLTLRGTSRR
jgi:hypothetical protein